MKQLFLTKVKYTKQLESGTFKRVTESYLFDAQSYTDCEASVYEQLAEQILGEFIITKIDRFECSNVIGSLIEGKYFLVKQTYNDIDITGREIKMKLLINSDTMEQAKEILQEFNDGEFIENEPLVKSIVETNILEYFQVQNEIGHEE